jgi:hypothetical protein
MIPTRFAALFLAVAFAAPSAAQTIKLGELNSYKVFPAFLEPYKRGMELAVDEVNASGGVLGRKLELVVRDDNGNPGDAVRVAEELLVREVLDGEQVKKLAMGEPLAPTAPGAPTDVPPSATADDPNRPQPRPAIVPQLNKPVGQE